MKTSKINYARGERIDIAEVDHGAHHHSAIERLNTTLGWLSIDRRSLIDSDNVAVVFHHKADFEAFYANLTAEAVAAGFLPSE